MTSKYTRTCSIQHVMCDWLIIVCMNQHLRFDRLFFMSPKIESCDWLFFMSPKQESCHWLFFMSPKQESHYWQFFMGTNQHSMCDWLFYLHTNHSHVWLYFSLKKNFNTKETCDMCFLHCENKTRDFVFIIICPIQQMLGEKTSFIPIKLKKKAKS